MDNNILTLSADVEMKKYLIKSEGKLYSLIGGSLQQLEAVEPTPEVFMSSGFEELPPGEIILELNNPTILYWQNTDEELPTIKAFIKATPYIQSVIVNKIDISHKSITGIETVSASVTGSPRFAVSFDGGEIWLSHNREVWTALSEENTGMLIDELLAITPEEWNHKIIGLNYFMIRFTLYTVEDSVTNIIFNFTN